MLHSVDSIQSRFQARVSLDQPALREWTVNEGSASSLEMVDCHVVPYDATYVSQVIGNLVGARPTRRHHVIEVRAVRPTYRVTGFSHDLARVACNEQFFQSSESTVVRQFLSNFTTYGETGVVRVNQVVRSFANDAQTVFTIDALVGRLAESGETYRHVRSKKWIIVRRCSEAPPEAPVTSIQCYYEFKPDEAEVAYKQLWRQAKIREMLIPTLDSSTTKSNQELENALVDEDKNAKADC